MSKQKKLPLPTRPMMSPKVAPDEPEISLPVSNLAKVISDLGFHQIVPPRFAMRKTFVTDKELLNHFGQKLAELKDSDTQIVSPSHAFGIFQKYLEVLKTRTRPYVCKWFYVAPSTESSAVGHEFGMLILGEDTAAANAQLMNSVGELFRELHIGDITLELNSIGCQNCQKEYHSILTEYLQKYNVSMCEECTEKLENGRLTVFSCQQARCREILSTAPQTLDSLDELCRSQLVGVLEALDALGFAYVLNPHLGGRLTHERIFFRVSSSGGEVLGEGANYAPWAKYLGHLESLPLISFVADVEKLWQAVPLEHQKPKLNVQVFLVSLGDAACRRALNLKRELRGAGIRTWETFLGHPGIRTQLREATESEADISLIIGQKEALDETVILRDMRSGMQEVFSHDRIVEEVKKRLS